MTKYLAESERLGLQLMTLEDHLEGWHAMNSDERFVKYLNREPCKNLEESRSLMISRLPSAENPHKEVYAIFLRGSEDQNGKPTMIGSCGIPRIGKDGNAIEVGYGIIPNYWGKGYAPEALKLFIHFYWNIREGEKKDNIIAYTDPSNVSSGKVLQKCGFTRGEVEEKAFQAPDEVTKEMKWFSALYWHLKRPKL